MPVLINEVVADVEGAADDNSDAEPLSQQLPLSTEEIDLTQLLALIEQRRNRLKVD